MREAPPQLLLRYEASRLEELVKVRVDGRFGFPGEQKEYEMALDYLQPAFGEARTRALRRSTGAYLAATRRFAEHGRRCHAC